MTEPLPDTWNSRELPVLRAVVRLYDETMQVVSVQDVERETGLSRADVQRAGTALDTAGLLTVKGSWQVKVMHLGRPSAEARRLAGSWPTPESGADRLIAALRELAEHGTEDERTRAQKLLDGFTDAGRQIAVSVAAAIITGQVT